MFIQNGGEILQKQIEEAVKNGQNQTVITGDYEIEKAIVLPQNFTVILEDAYLRLKDDSFCNIFINRSSVQPTRTLAERDYNIHILGKGRAILDGGKFNGLTERNAKEKGYLMYVNNLILLTNLENFSIKGIKLINQRWWAINLMYCSNGHVRDVEFCADDSVLYVDGERDYSINYKDLMKSHFDLLRNADGIDLRVGCHDILIENISGFTEDDTIALTSLIQNASCKYSVEGVEPSIHDITIKNVKSSSWCANVRMLNQGGAKLYNITVDGVEDTSKDSPHMNRGLYTVRVGDNFLYSTRHSTEDETYNITIKNIYARAEKIICLAGSIKNCVIENVNGFDNFGVKIENTAKLFGDNKIEI